jgi:glycosyltransferase involved in cell wall biosynthesis
MQITMYSSNSHFFTSGGSEIHIKELSEALLRLGVHVTVFSNSTYAKHEIVTSENGVKYHILPSPYIVRRYTCVDEGIHKAIAIFSYNIMSKRIMQTKADIYHQHDFISNYLTTVKLFKKGCKIILTNHLGEFLLLKKYLPNIVTSALLKPYHTIIGPSKELTPNAFHPRVKTIYNGYNDQIFYKSAMKRNNKRNELNVKANELLILVARRWAPTKGVLFAAKAAREISTFRSDIKWIFLCRDSPGFNSYKRKIESILKGVAGVIAFDTQPPEELAAFMNAADIALFPSLMEAVSIAALEAMACGTPVMTTNVGCMAELIQDSDTVLFLPGYKQSQIVESIIEIAHKRNMLPKIASAAEARVKQVYSWYSIAKRTLSVYCNLCYK